MLDGFVDSLLQSFENSRPGLTEEMVKRGEAEAFFRAIYEKEAPRLREAVVRDGLLSSTDREEMLVRVDEHIRRVVLSAYTRLAAHFTLAERNDFYLTPENLHMVERVGWAVAGLLLGLFVVEAPFIPLWSKEWTLVFLVGGLAFPSLRRLFALRRYQGQLNDLVGRTDDEIWRMDIGYVTSAAARSTATTPEIAIDEATTEATSKAQVARDAERLAHRLTEPPTGGDPTPRGPRGKSREGED